METKLVRQKKSSASLGLGFLVVALALSACSKEKFTENPPAAASTAQASSPTPTNPGNPGTPPGQQPPPGGFPPGGFPPGQPLYPGTFPPAQPVTGFPGGIPMMPELPGWIFSGGFDIGILIPFEPLFQLKRIVLLGEANQFLKESYDYQILCLWFLYNLGYRDFGFEKLDLVADDSDTSTQDPMTNAKIKAVAATRKRVRTFLNIWDISRLPGTDPVHIFEYSTSESGRVRDYVKSLPTTAKVVLIGHDLSLSKTPAQLSLTSPLSATETVGSAVTSQFPDDTLTMWMLNNPGHDSSLICEDEDCEMAPLDDDITSVLNPDRKTLLKASASLPFSRTGRYNFLTDQGNIFGNLKTNADLLFVVGKVHPLHVRAD